jgi:hypothetical protein
MGPGGLKSSQSSYSVTLPGSLFGNAIDKIDTNSEAFQKGVREIQNAIMSSTMSGGKTATIQVVGGASAVGEKQGYDNKSLANRRANNFVKEVKKLFPNVNFTIGPAIVGVATKKDSPEARKEQFVQLNVSGTKTTLSDKPAIDKTTAKLNIGSKKKKVPVITEKIYIVCFELTESEYQKFKESKISNKIVSARPK